MTATAYRLRLVVAWSLAVGTLVLAVLLAGPIGMPLSAWPSPVPLVAVTEAKAVAAASSQPTNLDAAERWTFETIAVRPGEATAWARLAWIASERGDTAKMLESLDRSYTVAPYGPEITSWRLRFAYAHWATLTPELRRLATEELVLTTRYRRRVVEAALVDISDPTGRLAFDLTRRRALAQID